jgi:hypothetical protein
MHAAIDVTLCSSSFVVILLTFHVNKILKGCTEIRKVRW